MARKFLYLIAILIVLVIGALAALRIFPQQLSEFVFVPRGEFTTQAALPANAYADPARWIARPGIKGNPAQWLPQGWKDGQVPGNAAVFFIHPTSYLANGQWNAPLDDAESRDRAELFVRAMASPFNGAGPVWAPRYRQAAFGAFLTDKPEGTQALDAAYADVRAAFERFLAEVPADAPIVLAGHSQGALHLKRLVAERIAGTPLAARVVAVYAVGWPVSTVHDLPKMGMPACTAPAQTGCVASWLSFGEPADTAMILDGYARRTALSGESPGGTPFVCTNPLNGGAAASAAAPANLGTLYPSADLKSGKVEPARVAARCGPDGFLYIGEGPELGPFVLPGKNYHVYDIPLFWANLRADVQTRLAAWQTR